MFSEQDKIRLTSLSYAEIVLATVPDAAPTFFLAQKAMKLRLSQSVSVDSVHR